MDTVQLLITCLIDTLQPDIGKCVYRLLRKCGVRVEFPQDQTCCGQPAYNAGLRTDARKSAKHTIEVFERTPGPVIIPSGSCTAMIRHGYPELFREDSNWLERAKALASRTFELTEYLVDIRGITDFNATYPETITYHPSCHLLRGIGVDNQPKILLKNIKQATFVELPHQEDCCGFGGVFSVKHPEISAEMLRRKINNIEATKATTVVVCDMGCLMHIAGGLHRLGKEIKVKHIAEILAPA